jgi:poly-gamma-glutamate synthesis protein (capsule biosynthesis protein)
VEGLVGRKLVWEESTKLKRVMGMPKESVDEHIPWDDLNRCFKSIEADYEEARKNADIVIFYPHAGGQFNVEPGNYTKQLVKMSTELGFDAVFAGHSHTSQRAEYVDGKPCFYSMGNVSMSPGTFYSVPECLPEYGLAAHLYTDDKEIRKVTFSIFKMVQEEGVPMRVIPVHDLYDSLEGEEKEKLAEDVKEIFARVTGRHEPVIPQQEYNL